MKQTKTSKPSKGRSDEPHTLPDIPSLESLEEISAGLGTFRERRRIAHTKDQPKLEATTKELETDSLPASTGRALLEDARATSSCIPVPLQRC
jgi:hypothetical protein